MTAPLVVGLLLAAAGCQDDKPQATPPPGPPPPASSAKAATCAGGGGTISDKVSAPFFPQTVGDVCLDPNGGEKTFGEQATLQLDQICDLFDGECEIYKGFNVRRVVEARYVDGKGSPATIDIYLSKFATSEAAYGMFTKRVVGDNDPASEDTPKALEGGGAAALGLGNAYLWRGAYLAEITYNDEAATEPVIKAAGAKLLPPLVKQMGDKLPGETAPPGPVALLPKDGMVPLGVRYVTKDVLGVEGVGGGAFGYYKEGDDRWRVASIARADAEQAKDVLASFAKATGATKEKNVGEGAVRLSIKESEGVPTEWVFARVGKSVIGIGDEPRVLKAGMTADEMAKVSLTKDEKLERLKKILPAP
ncbi:MAG: DUF6599 family protein [Polyangiaceae bacterium]